MVTVDDVDRPTRAPEGGVDAFVCPGSSLHAIPNNALTTTESTTSRPRALRFGPPMLLMAAPPTAIAGPPGNP